MKPFKYILLHSFLIGIIVFMLSYTPKSKSIELFDNTNNYILGGAIITLQYDLTKLMDNLDILDTNIQKIYSVTDLSGNNTTIGKLYKNVQNIKNEMYGVIDTDILQPISKNENVKPSQILSNPKIKCTAKDKCAKDDYQRWTNFSQLLTSLKKKFEIISGNIDTYIAELSDMELLPSNSSFKTEHNKIINILKSMPLIIKTINIYITGILK